MLWWNVPGLHSLSENIHMLRDIQYHALLCNFYMLSFCRVVLSRFIWNLPAHQRKLHNGGMIAQSSHFKLLLHFVNGDSPLLLWILSYYVWCIQLEWKWLSMELSMHEPSVSVFSRYDCWQAHTKSTDRLNMVAGFFDPVYLFLGD